MTKVKIDTDKAHNDDFMRTVHNLKHGVAMPEIEDEAETDKLDAPSFGLSGDYAKFQSQETLDAMNGISPEQRRELKARDMQATLMNEYLGAYDAPVTHNAALGQTAAALVKQLGYTEDDFDDAGRRREFIAQVGLAMGHQRRPPAKPGKAKGKAKAEADGEGSALAAEVSDALDGGAGAFGAGDIEADNNSWIRELGDFRVKRGMK